MTLLVRLPLIIWNYLYRLPIVNHDIEAIIVDETNVIQKNLK